MPEAGVSAEDLLEAAEAGRLRLPVEVGAFILLQCVEELTAQPRAFSARDVFLDESGQVRIRAAGPSSEHEATLAATKLLKRLLLASTGASPSALLSWLERSQSAGRLELEAMRDEVEAALVPLNREAATRLLARFIRTSASVSADGAAPDPLDTRALDDELDRFLHAGPSRASAGERGDDLVASKLVEKAPFRGPSLTLTLTVLAIAALVGLTLSRLAL
jgi:hypothetical protein